MATAPTSTEPDVSQRAASGKLFPLHLAPIDAFFCLDDRPGYPMMSIIQLDFTGAVQRKPFVAALGDALERHPLLASHVRPAKRGRPCWVPAENPLPPISWGAADEPVRVENEGHFDLSCETGLRFWVRQSAEQARITLQVHHACTDGTGVYRFLGDLLAAYASHVDPTLGSPEFTPLSPMLLKKRRVKMADVAVNRSSWQFIRHGLWQALQVFGKRVRGIKVTGTAASADEAFPGIHTEFFTREEHKQLREAAANYGVMLNDLLLAEMFRAINGWNDARGGSQRDAWLRIMMPYDMRGKEDYAMPAANMTAYTFLTRRANACRDIGPLIRTIRDETSQIKGRRLGSAFIDAIMLAEFSPRTLSFLLSGGRCIATAILSNVGDPSKRFTARLPREGGKIRAGNLVLEQVTGVPPFRPQSHATLAVFSYARQLAISLRCDPKYFNSKTTQAFLDTYVRLLRSHLAS